MHSSRHSDKTCSVRGLFSAPACSGNKHRKAVCRLPFCISAQAFRHWNDSALLRAAHTPPPQPAIPNWGGICVRFVHISTWVCQTFTWNGPSVAKVKHKGLFFCRVQQGWAQQREQAVEERQEVNLFSVHGFGLSFDLSCYIKFLFGPALSKGASCKVLFSRYISEIQH